MGQDRTGNNQEADRPAATFTIVTTLRWPLYCLNIVLSFGDTECEESREIFIIELVNSIAHKDSGPNACMYKKEGQFFPACRPPSFNLRKISGLIQSSRCYLHI